MLVVISVSTLYYTELEPMFRRLCGIKRVDIKPGMLVRVVTKEDQRTGRLTEGVVKDILTKSPTHPHGIKVRLESGIVGRVKDILS